MNKIIVTIVYNNGQPDKVFYCQKVRAQCSSPASKVPDMLVLYGEQKIASIPLADVGVYYCEAM